MADLPSSAAAPGGPPLQLVLSHGDLGPALIAVVWTLAVASGFSLALRLFCKLSRGRLWWDDFILTASWVSTHSRHH